MPIYNIDAIRPYFDHEVKAAIERLTSDPYFIPATKYLFPEWDSEELVARMLKFRSVYEFQSQIMHKVIRVLVDRSSTTLTCTGLEKIDKNRSYLFISNHRDIVLDSGILQILLHEQGFETTEISFGDNLMETQFSTDVGKLNKMFTVFRGEKGREFYENSKRLSEYIRHAIVEKKSSVWIAQRNGRTKDGHDLTETALLKMINVSGQNDFYKNFSDLSILPIAMSYEYEPCDIQKTKEIYQASRVGYLKVPGEDRQSIIVGATQSKGHIQMTICDDVNDCLVRTQHITNENEKHRTLANCIDQQIYKNYKLWPTNYIAADLLDHTDRNSHHYSKQEFADFSTYCEEKLAPLSGDKKELRELFLGIYANPVYNFEKTLAPVDSE